MVPISQHLSASFLGSIIMNTRTQLSLTIAVAVTLAAVVPSRADVDGQNPAKQIDGKTDSARKAEAPSPVPEKHGVLLNESRAFPGYNLINPSGKTAYLYDNEGRVVHSWTSEYSGFSNAYLLENGHLFRTAEATNRNDKPRQQQEGHEDSDVAENRAH